MPTRLGRGAERLTAAFDADRDQSAIGGYEAGQSAGMPVPSSKVVVE
jgi:hypothetical protein